MTEQVPDITSLPPVKSRRITLKRVLVGAAVVTAAAVAAKFAGSAIFGSDDETTVNVDTETA